MQRCTFFYTLLMVPRDGRQQGSQICRDLLGGNIYIREREIVEGEPVSETGEDSRRMRAFISAILSQGPSLEFVTDDSLQGEGDPSTSPQPPAAGTAGTSGAADAAGAVATSPVPPSSRAKGRGPTSKAAAQKQPSSQQQEQQQEQQQQEQQGQGQPPAAEAAVMLRGMFGMGMEPGEAFQAVHGPLPTEFLTNGLCNGVRFGLVEGKTRLLVAEQSGYVYIFELPTSSCASMEQALCSGLEGADGSQWRMRPVNCCSAVKNPVGARLKDHRPERQPQAKELALARNEVLASHQTAALGPFPAPCNLAEPSPDGRWIAVVGDFQAVVLLDQQADFARRTLPFSLLGANGGAVEQGIDVGSQYMAWNSSSSLLAASSDALHAIFVFEPASGAMVMRVEAHMRPCLCVGFAAWDDSLLVYSEDHQSVHLHPVPLSPGTAAEGDGASGAACVQCNALDDFKKAGEGVQLLQLPRVPDIQFPADHTGRRMRRVTGLATLPQGELLATTRQGALIRYFSSKPWRQEEHLYWPPAFQAAVKSLLLCGHRQHQRQLAQGGGGNGGEVGLWSLPLPLVQEIVGMAAGKRTDWLPPAPPDSPRGFEPPLHGAFPPGQSRLL